MAANSSIEETNLVDAAVTSLRQWLAPGWEVERSGPAEFAGSGSGSPDVALVVRDPNGTFARVAVEARSSFTPRDVERMLPRLTQLIRSLAGNVPVLVVAPWLSARTQELLRQQGINFIDLTGNAEVRLAYPALFIRTQGAARNPQPEIRSRPRVRGPKAGRLIRFLADITPPYGVKDVADGTGLAPGYVSRLLDALDSEALVERSRRGQVSSVDVPGLLHRWATTYDVFETNDARPFLFSSGGARALARLADTRAAERVAITGSFAASRLAPVAAPALLLVYCEEMPPIIHTLGLLPAEEGANVVLLDPFDAVVWERTDRVGGISYVAPSQAVIDCLTGPGRMPAEGEALLAWMTEDESRWRQHVRPVNRHARQPEPHARPGH